MSERGATRLDEQASKVQGDLGTHPLASMAARVSTTDLLVDPDRDDAFLGAFSLSVGIGGGARVVTTWVQLELKNFSTFC